MKSISVEIRTPEALVLQADYEYVVLPGYEGELGVLPGHASLALQLMPGKIRLKNNGKADVYSVTGGFAEIQPAKVSVFAEEVTPFPHPSERKNNL